MSKQNRSSIANKPAMIVTKAFIKTKDRIYEKRVKPLIDDLLRARSRKDRICAIRDLQEYLDAWLQLMQYPIQKSISTKPMKTSFWSSFFGRNKNVQESTPPPPSPPTRRSKFYVPMVPMDAKTCSAETDFSLCSPTPVSVVSVKSATAKIGPVSTVSVSTPASFVFDEPSYIVENAVAESETVQEEELASLHLMTCDSLGNGDSQPSVVVKSTAMAAYDSKKVYESYHLQTVETRVFDEGQEGQEMETTYSTAPVSSDQASASIGQTNKDDAPGTQHEKRVANYEDRAAIMQEVLKQVTAIFEGSQLELGDGSLDVEVLEVAPCDQGDIPMAPALPAANEREEVESLRSTRSGLVRKMVGVFSRSK